MVNFRKLFLGLFLTASLSAPALACDNSDEEGLDVGLVLSGGGAKASTQVGVMQIMDELGVPIHCIAGTSMGAVVGSFYANGYSADEIGTILTDNDWGALFRGQTPRRDKSFVEKQREESYFSGNIASYSKRGLKLPGGLSSMQGLKTHYRHILSDVPTNADFDEFPIPFRAVATNLHKGQATEFKDGDVVEAILASMAVPGVFAPREIAGEIYVDGGLSSTLPVKTVKDMGADIVIAIDVSNIPTTPSSDISVAATATQITTIVVWRSLQRDLTHMSDGDLLIEPNRELNIGTAAYAQSAEGIEEGRKYGLANAQAFRDIIALAAPARRKIKKPIENIAPETFVLNNRSRLKDGLITRRVASDLKLTDPEKLDRRLRNLASFGGFGEIDVGRSNGETVLTVNRNPLGRNLIQVGLNATSNFEGKSSYSVLARLTRKPIGPRGGDISLSGEFGTNVGLSAEIYQPFGREGKFFIQPELFATWERRELDFIVVRVGDFWERNLGIRGRVGRELGDWGIIALEAETKDTRLSKIISIDPDTANTIKGTQTSAGIFFAVDTLDRTDWPSSGQRLRASGKRAFAVDNTVNDTDLYEASWLGAFRLGTFNTLVNARYGTNPGDRTNVTENFTLGGFRQMSSFADNSIFADEFKFISVEAFRRLTTEGRLLDLPIYVGAIGEYAEIPIDLLDGAGAQELDLYSGSLYLGIETPLGPLFLGGAYGNNEVTSLFFKFGRTF